jgi:ATP-dependent Clp protease ATP-binding subunit ClpB
MFPIVDIQLRGLEARLADRRVALEITDAARARLADLGYDPTFGARPLKRAIQAHLTDKLALLVLDGTLAEDSTVVVDAADGELTFHTKAAAAAV